MAKNQTTEATENTEAAGEATEATEKKVDGRNIFIEHPEHTKGQRVKRTEWIREVYQDANSPFFGKRGAIAKALSEMQGKAVPFQIVFAATKDLKDPASAIRAQKTAEREAKAAEKANAKGAGSTEGAGEGA